MKKAFQDPIDTLGKRQSGTIDKLLDGYMSKFTVYQSPHLFDMNDTIQLIKEMICPICLCRLKTSKKGDVYCNSKLHMTISKKRLFITKNGFEKLSPTE